MPDTLEALAVTFLAVLPGAVYVWASERQTGAWGIKFSDRLLRFVGVSAIFLALFAVPVRWLWTTYLHVPVQHANGKITFAAPLLDGTAAPRFWWLFPLIYVALPFALGTLAGKVVARRREFPRAATMLAGPDPAPTAWEEVFSQRRGGLLRIRMTQEAGGGWIAGVFAANSYASGYGEEPADLYLERVVHLHADGSFEEGPDGKIVLSDFGVLLKRGDIATTELLWRD
jgi:Family of unknown function (DUF6338)